MILQPSLIVLVGPETAALADRLPRWFSSIKGSPLPIRLVPDAGDLGSKLVQEVIRLRSSLLLQELSIADIAPASGTTFRALLVVDYARRSDAAAVIAAINHVLDDLPFGATPTRQFWLIVLGPSTLDEARSFRDGIMQGRSPAESRIAFSIMPSWRDTNPSPEELLTAAERLTMLLALIDSDPESSLMQLLNNRPTTSFVVGVESYWLRGLDHAIDGCLYEALVLCVKRSLSGSPPDPATLARLVYSCCPSFDLDAAIPPGTPEAATKQNEYAQKEVPAILNALAGYSANISEWEQLIETIRFKVSPQSRALGRAQVMCGFSLETAAIAVLAGFVSWLFYKVFQARPKTVPEPAQLALKMHPVLFEALSAMRESLAPLLRPTPIQDLTQHLTLDHPILLGETADTAKASREDVNRAAQVLLEAHLPLIATLSIGWLKGLSPVASLPAAFEAQKACRAEVRRLLLQNWSTLCEKRHGRALELSTSYLFAPAQPDGHQQRFLLARRSLLPAAHEGLYSDDHLHYLYLVTY